jgi:hypothetical protein
MVILCVQRTKIQACKQAMAHSFRDALWHNMFIRRLGFRLASNATSRKRSSLLKKRS